MVIFLALRKKTRKLLMKRHKPTSRKMLKLKAYFRTRETPVIVYMDSDLQDYRKIFADIEDYLMPAKRPNQLEFHALEDFLAFKTPK